MYKELTPRLSFLSPYIEHSIHFFLLRWVLSASPHFSIIFLRSLNSQSAMNKSCMIKMYFWIILSSKFLIMNPCFKRQRKCLWCIYPFKAIAQFGHLEVTPSFCLVTPDATLTTNPSQGRFSNNSPAIHSLCHRFTCFGSAVRFVGGISKNQLSSFLISSISFWVDPREPLSNWESHWCFKARKT